MSVADDWDAIPAAKASAASPGALADEWDSIKPDEAKAAAKAALPREALRVQLEKTLDRGLAVPQAVGNVVSGVGASILGGWRGLATIASGGSMQDAVDAVHQTAQEGTYRPPEGTAGATAVGALESPKNPLNWPSMASHRVGEVVADTIANSKIDPILRDAIAPVAGAAVDAGGNLAAPGAILKAGGKVTALARRPGLPVIDAEVIPPKEVPLAAIGRGENLEVPTYLRRGGKVAAETPGRAPLALVPKEGEAPLPATVAAPKPTLTLAPQEPTRGRAAALDQSPPEAAAKAAEEVAPKFSEVEPRAPAGSTLGQDEQARRSGVLARIGIPAAEQRVSAVAGDGTGASTEFHWSKLESEAGRTVKARLDAEREALTEHADKIVRETGGTPGTDGQTLEARGHTILQPLDSLKGWFEKQTRALYKAADERAKGVPMEMPDTHALIGGDQAEFLGTTDGTALLSGLKARMKTLGMLDKEGAPQPVTVERAERLKQYLNEQWQPRTSKVIGKLKDAIDDDVTRSAGEDIYKQARAMRAMRGATLDNPNGIAKVMDASGPEGINRAVPTERIPDAITAMPNAQFAHIVETLKHVPPELQGQARGALAEIKAQFANRIRDAGASRVGQWGARDVSAYLNKNSAKLAQVFSEEEMGRIRDLNDAGHILAQDRSYPGAAVQASNLMEKGAIATLPKAGAAAGGALGALIGAPGTGALVGETLGSKAAARVADKAALREVGKRWGVRLSDFPK